MLVLHGGRTESRQPVSPFQLAVLRVNRLAAAVHRQVGRRGVAVWTLQFSVRGWNGHQESPVADARWALAEIHRQGAGRPVVVVGHSMGGRTALRVADDADVTEVVALAPWVPDGEPVAQLAGRRVLIAHGTADRITDPARSRAYAERARDVASSVRLIDVPGESHAMLRHPGTWNRLTTDGVLDGLGLR